MYVVLDANILFGNWYLEGPHFTVLERHIKLGQSTLVVPEIVVLETKNLFKKELSKHISSVKEIDRLVPNLKLGSYVPDIETLCTEYEKALHSRFVELGVDVIAHSDIPHSSVVSRALAIRKPFRKSDKGYRDTLLWEVILNKVANSNSITFLITNNHKDFGHKNKRQLHPDLTDDLVKHNLAPESVRLYTNLKEFLDDQIVPHLERVTKEILGELRQGQYKSFSIDDWFGENRSIFIKSSDKWIEDLLSSTTELENPEVTYIENPEKISVEDARNLDDDRVYLDATALADVVVDVFIFKSDYYQISEEYTLDIMDEDWNKHYMWAQMILRLPISFSLVFNILEEKVEEFEINPMQEIFGWCKNCGAPILSDAAEECPECGKRFF